MDYAQARTETIQARFNQQADEFIDQYDPGRPTVLLLPGGMGSQLDRTSKPYRSAADLPLNRFDPVWLDLGAIFDNDTLDLEIRPDGADKGSHIVVPNGPLRFAFMDKPYDGTARHVRQTMGCNYFCFGYDWRRSIDEAAGFLANFLREVTRRLDKLWKNIGRDRRLFVVGHSMGGLVGLLALRRWLGPNPTAAEADAKVTAFVTVGTPFYGTCSHMTRYYAGEPMLNWLHDSTTIARVVTSMPGPYILIHAGLDAALGPNGPRPHELPAYPVRDSITGSPLDPADPAHASLWPRVARTGELGAASRRFLAESTRVRDRLIAPLPPALANRTFHIRSGLVTTSPASLLWDTAAARAHAPGGPAPFVAVAGPSDNTVPFWSAALRGTPDSRVFNLSRADDHMMLMEHDEVLGVITHIAANGSLPSVVPTDPAHRLPQRADRATAKTLIDGAKAGTLNPDAPLAQNSAVLRALVEGVQVC